MKKQKILVLATLFLVYLFGLSLVTSVGFTTAPQFTDATGDATPEYTDILKVWIANDGDWIRCKVELNDPWNETLSGNYVYFLISTNNATGNNMGWFSNFLVDYIIAFSPTGTSISVDFYDYNNGANSLDNTNLYGMAYYSLTNGNQTVEMGYKVNSTYSGSGLLSLNVGDTIFIKFYAGTDSDYAPDVGAEPIRYVMQEDSSDGIPGFTLYLLFVALFAIIILHLTRKSPIKF